MRLVKVHGPDRNLFQAQLTALEAIATYPLGEDRFQIDHGPDYFRFFDRMGKFYAYAISDQERVVALGAGIIRHVPEKVWYLCDLKVHPEYRGKHLPLKILRGSFLPNYLRCTRGYCISMNPKNGEPNRIVKLLSHFRWAPLKLARNLLIYSLDEPKMRAAQAILKRHRGDLSYLSLTGVKDIVLASTGKPMPLLHVQFGPCAKPGELSPLPGHTHMFAAPEGDPLALELRQLGIGIATTASIIHHRMGKSDWKFILTSEI